jgi:CheY-like chemotaxis protein
VSPPDCQRRVLVVEDDRDVRDSLLEVLEDNAYAPLAASNGKEALERLRASEVRPCVILLDVMMPVMDGWGFRAAQTETARDMHAAGYLKKPVSIDALLEAVQRHCEPGQ